MKLLLSLAAVAFVLVAATSAAPQQHNQKVAPVAVADDLFREDAEPTTDSTQSSTEVPTTGEPSTEVATSEGPTETVVSTEETSTEETASPGTGSTEEPASPGTGSTEEPASPGTGSTEEPASPGTGSTEEPVTPGDEGLSDGEIAGIVLGSLAGVALIAGGIFIMHKKKIACFA